MELGSFFSIGRDSVLLPKFGSSDASSLSSASQESLSSRSSSESGFSSSKSGDKFERRKAKHQIKLGKAFQSSLDHQTLATAGFMKVADKAVTENPVIRKVSTDQMRYHLQNFLRAQQKRFGNTENLIPQSAEPHMTPKEKIGVGGEALSLTPDAYHSALHLEKSQDAWNKAVRREQRFLAKYGDPSMKPLFTEENADPEILHSPAFQGAVKRRYGQNPFAGRSMEAIRFGHITPDMPQPIQYRSSKGWEYKPEQEFWLQDAGKNTGER